MAKRNTKLCKTCPFEGAMDIIGGKWKGAILFKLFDSAKRFNELKNSISGISQRMLTQQLRELENAKVITRQIDLQVPPKVEYALTQQGRNLEPILLQIRAWGKQMQIENKQ